MSACSRVSCQLPAVVSRVVRRRYRATKTTALELVCTTVDRSAPADSVVTQQHLDAPASRRLMAESAGEPDLAALQVQ